MNPIYPVKEEYRDRTPASRRRRHHYPRGDGGASRRRTTAVPDQDLDMVNDPASDRIVSWSREDFNDGTGEAETAAAEHQSPPSSHGYEASRHGKEAAANDEFSGQSYAEPAFIQRLVQQKEKRKELEEAISKKRRRPIDQGPSGETSQIGEGFDFKFNPIKAEPLEPEINLDLEFQSWKHLPWRCRELLSEKFDGERSEEEDVNVLASQLGHLGSCGEEDNENSCA
ncbi:unnamed protein product, partial [Thlaspi arvense]